MPDAKRSKPLLRMTIQPRPGHGIRVRVIYESESRESIRLGSGEYHSPKRIETFLIPTWRAFATFMRWDFEVRRRGLDQIASACSPKLP